MEDLFGRKCIIPTGFNKRPFVYRILSSNCESTTWCEVPLTYQSEKEPVRHDHMEPILFVVNDALVSDDSKIIRVARKDVTLIQEE